MVSITSIVTAREQLEAIRDEWLAPLVERIGELEREAGRLTAQRNQAFQERDKLQARLSIMEAQQEHPATPAPSAPETVTDAATDVAWWQFWRQRRDR